MSINKDGYQKEVYILACDLGTHIDSPSHFIKGDRTIVDLKITELICPLVVIDVSLKVEKIQIIYYKFKMY
jgi:kynurenine formamidase